MDIHAKESGIVQKTLDLCQAVVEQPDFQAVKEKFDAFVADEFLKFQFQQVNDLGQLLQMKASEGLEVTNEERATFEEMREKFLSNPVAQGFLDAQQQMQQLQQVVGKFIDKTFELGRRPEFDDLQDGSCGGCGCH
jgi:cell fate (sporulation/competence/biofilm development) regulator YlbF (YheA/YmcA/DUF963 family)